MASPVSAPEKAYPSKPRRTRRRKIKDFITFPLRAVTLFTDDKWGLSSLKSERLEYVSAAVTGYCLDIGCGHHNSLINDYLGGKGKGIDVYLYDGLTEDHIVADMTKLPFDDGLFDTVTFIANLNHIPKPIRDDELAEAYRVLRGGGNIIVTMGNPVAEVLVHKVVYWHDRLLGTSHDMDSERGMHEDEEYYLTNSEIVTRLTRAGFKDITKKYFLTQWGLNHLFIAWKR